MNLSKATKVTRHEVAVAAGSTDITPSGYIDMQNFEGCMFIINFGTITATAVTGVRLQQCDTSGGTYADLEGSAQVVADSDDDQAFIIDCYRPQERYLKVIIDRATANAVLDGITAIQYGPRKLPVSDDSSTVGGSELLVSVAEGTA
jgi:hypothetical protein|tara:strand:+ start:1308 stop:1748 length:441 start_codon:yes stop_codon:yes gene_type:complete